MKKNIKIKFINGLDFQTFVREVFEVNGVTNYYSFEDSDNPDFVVFGPYGNNIPPKSNNYIRIGYYCENMTPDMSICEWAFGVPRQDEVNHSKYFRIQWHGVDPNDLIKKYPLNIEQIIERKPKFCNFIYSNRVTHREEFFEQLSKYKKVDAPGKSMTNMPSIDTMYQGDVWQSKRNFIDKYKFTIAFENYSYPGYQTEKLYDPMKVNSIPIYCGDPFIGDIFNTKSMINAFDILNIRNSDSITFLEKYSQMNFRDMRPNHFNDIPSRLQRKLKYMGRQLKMKYKFNKLDYSPLIDKIIEIDKNPDLYREMLLEPWFNENKPPLNSYSTNPWRLIFN